MLAVHKKALQRVFQMVLKQYFRMVLTADLKDAQLHLKVYLSVLKDEQLKASVMNYLMKVSVQRLILMNLMMNVSRAEPVHTHQSQSLTMLNLAA